MLDPVRFLSNRSSGRMGYAVARAALRRGAEVTLISGPSHLDRPKGARFVTVESAKEMRDAVARELRSSHLLIMSAAVSDFTPREMSAKKVEKRDELFLRLYATSDIISEAARKRKRPFIIGFAAETGGDTRKAKKKLREKKMDLIVFNDVTEAGAGFDVETNKVVLIDTQKETVLPLMSKDSVADAILDRFVEMKA